MISESAYRAFTYSKTCWRGRVIRISTWRVNDNWTLRDRSLAWLYCNLYSECLRHPKVAICPRTLYSLTLWIIENVIFHFLLFSICFYVFLQQAKYPTFILCVSVYVYIYLPSCSSLKFRQAKLFQLCAWQFFLALYTRVTFYNVCIFFCANLFNFFKAWKLSS